MNLPPPPASFVSDGCTDFPNTWRGIDLSGCCRAHDWAYYNGHSFADFFTANVHLGECVWSTGAWDAAVLMVAGVTVFGALFFLGGAKAVGTIRKAAR